MFISTALRGAAFTRPFVRLVLAAFLTGLPIAGVHAQSCELSFKVSGDRAHGWTYEATDAGTGVGAGDALAAMKTLAGPEGFTVGKESLSGDLGTLKLVQPASAVARSYTVDISAATGSVSMKTDLPSGMDANPESVRTYMCGLLAKVRPSSQIASGTGVIAGASGAGSPAVPKPFSPEQTAALCMANVAVNVEEVDDSREVIGSWTLYDGGGDAHAAFGRLKQLAASEPGMRVASERYVGQQGTLELVSTPVPATNDPADDVPIRVDVDAGMGAVSVVDTMRRSTAALGGWPAYHVCRMAAIASGTPLPAKPGAAAPEAPRRKLFNNPFKKQESPLNAVLAKRYAAQKAESDAQEAFYERATHAGKAFVIVPVLSMERKYRGIDTRTLQTQKIAPFWADGSANVQWRASGAQGDGMIVGAWTNLTRVGLHGFLDVVDIGKARYALYVVDPGKYELVAAAMESRGGFIPKPPGGKPVSATIGTYATKNTTDRFYAIGQEWHDATFEAHSYDQSYCMREIVGSGQCVQWGSDRQHYDTQTSAAGYRDKLETKMVPGLTITTELTKPFASFEVARDDVALVDGFMLDRDGPAIDPNGCKASGNGATCGLTELVLWRLPAALQELKDGLAASGESPAKPTLFSKAVAKGLTVHARALHEPLDGYQAGWARQYELKAH